MKISMLAVVCAFPLYGITNHFQIHLVEIENELNKKLSVYDESDRFITNILPKQTLPFNYSLSEETITRSRNIQNGIIEAKFSNFATSRSIRFETEPSFANGMKNPQIVLLLKSELTFDRYMGRYKVELEVIDYHTGARLAEKIKSYDAYKDHSLQVKLEIGAPKRKTDSVSVDLDLKD